MKLDEISFSLVTRQGVGSVLEDSSDKSTFRGDVHIADWVPNAWECHMYRSRAEDKPSGDLTIRINKLYLGASLKLVINIVILCRTIWLASWITLLFVWNWIKQLYLRSLIFEYLIPRNYFRNLEEQLRQEVKTCHHVKAKIKKFIRKDQTDGFGSPITKQHGKESPELTEVKRTAVWSPWVKTRMAQVGDR